MPHPPEVALRIERLCAFHEATKQTPAPGTTLSAAQKPSTFRTFTQCPRIPLPTRLLDAPTATLKVLAQGLAALPQSIIDPPQDLKTLASWLHLAAGITGRVTEGEQTRHLRSYPSAGAAYPCEIYVLALGIDGLEAGFYHFSVKDFSLYRLRGGYESLALLKRGRPDLEMLKTTPAVFLVSTVFWRSAWHYGDRAYRYATLDAGHLIENLVQAGTGMGIQTIARLHLNERNTRELIGVSQEASFDRYEAVQGLVVWANQAHNPIPAPARRPAPILLPLIERTPASTAFVDHPEIRRAHDDCIAPGVAVHEVRPPYTDRCPLPEGSHLSSLFANDVFSDLSVFQTLQKRRSVRTYESHGISRDHFVKLNRLVFRNGTYHPLVPAGPHLGLVRPYWFVHNITGVASGLWFYHANYDQFTCLREADLKFDCKYLFNDQALCEQASAVCAMVVNLKDAMNNSGPDTYRLAHLEAGVAGERLYLASTAMAIDCCALGDFRDDELQVALDLGSTDWQCLYGMALGGIRRPKTAQQVPAPLAKGPEINLR